MDRSEFPPEPMSVRAARAFVASRLGADDDADAVMLATSELCTNAVIHAGTPFTVSVDRDRRGLTVSVHDQHPARPELLAVDASRPGGRGLRIVDAYTDEWGVTEMPGSGKTVWFRVRPRGA